MMIYLEKFESSNDINNSTAGKLQLIFKSTDVDLVIFSFKNRIFTIKNHKG